MNCRFLKIKCDGSKPICGPCLRHPKDDACEYSDGPGRSRTKALEDQVSRLEARLQELENPEASTPSVKLHDPYAPYEPRKISRSPPPQLFLPVDTMLTVGPLSPFSPTSTSSSLPSGSSGPSGPSKSPLRQLPTNSPFLGTEEPSFLLIQNLMDKFLPHASEFGFFLHVPTFRQTALLTAPFGDHARPTPALLSVVYLWGVHLSRSDALLLQEHAFLTRAVQHVATDMIGSHPNRVVHTLQAHILLAYYFFITGRYLEAKCQSSSAVSLALGSGLHKLRSANVTALPALGVFNEHTIRLEPHRSDIEEGERINAFWAALTLHKIITVALDPITICGAMEAPINVDVPWPLDMEQYAQGQLGPDVRGNGTTKRFTYGYPSETDDSSSAARLAKASILLHRTCYLAATYNPNMQQREMQGYVASFQVVTRLIEELRSQLPALSGHEAGDPMIRHLILTHALLDAALIKLHTPFSYGHSVSKQQCLSSARNIVKCGGLNLQEVGYLNPVMGMVWMNACFIFIDEISRIRAPWTDISSPGGGGYSEEQLMEYLADGLRLLSSFEDNTFVRHQLGMVQDAFSAI